MTRRARIIVWGASVLCVLVAAGLGALAVAGGLDRADKVASIVGAVIGLAGLVVSLYALHRSPAPGPVPPAPGPAAGTGSATVAEGVRSVAAGGSIGRAVTGDGVSLTGPAPVLPPSSGSGSGSGGGGGAAGSARATGERSVAAGGDIGEAVTGDGPRA
ncbi:MULTISPECIES: hypothetical protein [unclassified Streptomyces]|uniref:hypothetical protein n=1 Tax=unclassified Streptomyces TaxID=2593676 RepID=UPI001AF759B9|nr:MULTISPECIES: hypothetical protein [unclassified Streptomyces]CAD5963271.1 conserved protein of unknown function [Streptomyces sp. KY70]CAD5979034.1 conserved protein of unknown function [Streptomyces sp. KY75]